MAFARGVPRGSSDDGLCTRRRASCPFSASSPIFPRSICRVEQSCKSPFGGSTVVVETPARERWPVRFWRHPRRGNSSATRCWFPRFPGSPRRCIESSLGTVIDSSERLRRASGHLAEVYTSQNKVASSRVIGGGLSCRNCRTSDSLLSGRHNRILVKCAA